MSEKQQRESFQDTLQKEQQRHSDKEDSKEQEQATPEEVQKAIERFASDGDTIAQGLTAQSEGTGPGLRVLLKDQNGSLIRQLSGEEFLKLRNTVTQKRGKILDQKF